MKKYVIEENFYNISGFVVEAVKGRVFSDLVEVQSFLIDVEKHYKKGGFQVESDSEEIGFFTLCNGKTFSHVRVKMVIEEYL
jgi:hypothetical protein